MLRPVITSYGLNASSGQALVLLDQLRSLSGRLALKLISSPNQRAEALGLALSRLFLSIKVHSPIRSLSRSMPTPTSTASSSCKRMSLGTR